MVRRAYVSGRVGRLLRALIGQAELPLDVMLDLPRVILIGEMQVQVENHQGVLLFTPDEVHIRTRTGDLHIRGERLRIGSIFREEVVVEGRIHALEMEPKERLR